MTAPFDLRRPEGGRIDRARAMRFVFDGAGYSGYAGDTLASALLANGVRLVARSFKYHRPRGIATAGAEEPNALVQLRGNARSEPNIRATQVELYDGLVAASQNRWPSLELDLGALNSVFAKLLPAGFYYKTFMWPPGFWHFYERLVRRMAGMGRAADASDPDRYDHRWAHCDVLVVGAGPSGLAAALAAGRAGARVILCDEQAEPGGSLLGSGATLDGAPAMQWAGAVLAELGALPDVTVLPRTTAFGYYDHNALGLVERVADHAAEPLPGQPRQRLWLVRARQVVLATGAIERPLVFRDNDRPGVMLADAARTYLGRYAVACGRRAVLFTNNDHAYDAALALHAGGVDLAAIVDLRAEPGGLRVDAARARGLRVIAGRAVTATHGRSSVTGVDIARLQEGSDLAVLDRESIACDLVLNSGGWTPSVHLFSQSGGRLRYDEATGAFLPGRAVQAVRAAGSCNGAVALKDCLKQGAAAGAAAAGDCGFAAAPPALPAAEPEPESAPMRLLWVVPSDAPVGHKGKHFVDLQNDVTAADLRLAAREGYRSVEHLKRYTTTGMGTDQGKTSNLAALAILAEATGREIPAVGTTTFRPPYTPVAMGALTGRTVGALLDPARWTPIHRWHVRAGAVFENVGQWQRARYYPQAGEDMHRALARELHAARNAVGIFDASTLGKIDVKGPDAARFLDLVYTNSWSKLGIGRCRYGFMLREDGYVFDDGVTTRLADDHFLVSTTTGNAAPVLSWLEDLLQMEWTELKVRLTSVTEEYAVVTLSGPFARRVLTELTADIDLEPKAFPFMSLSHGTVAGIAARVFRVSFTGELSYEVQVKASYGLALWNACMEAGEKYGITPYGTEAMHVLRAEKGYVIVGQETDGTVTPYDLGMGWIVNDNKPDFIGKRGLRRADLQRPDRKQLVGLRLEAGERRKLPEGAHLVADRDAVPPMPMLGHVTSSYWSVALDAPIALAMIKGGRARMGETVYAPLPDRVAAATVVEPCFWDPEGKRLHG
ncbi:MAG: sarcosine oxidase subunit alpha family protein [Alphaproteobacteria bacterium]|nr:sarcosine oxidase subunit alpha family protein [Alphaproteobacteria bacterium]